MASGEEAGILRVIFDNEAESNPRPPIDFPTVVHSQGAITYPTGANLDAIPMTGGAHRQAGKRVTIQFVAAATDIVESEECGLHIPMLLLDAVTKRVIGKKIVTFESMTGFTVAGTVDITATIAIPTKIAYEDAPAGMLFALDPAGKVHGYVGDDA